jgi:general secretion pathway protein K
MGFPRDDEFAGAMSVNLDGKNQSVLLNQRGAALLIVLWIFIFLLVVAFDFSTAVREEAAAAHRYNDETQGYYLALAGFQRGVYELLQQSVGRDALDAEKRADIFDGRWREETLSGGVFRVRWLDEGGKININRADEGTLRRVFTNLGVEEPLRTILVDSIMDWRDPDNLHRLNGAENEYYRSLTPPYTARNGPFDTVEDLLWVRGVTSEIFYGYDGGAHGRREEDAHRIALREIFTVDSPIDRVNLRTASAEVIHAVAGIPLEKSRGFVEERRKSSDKTLADLLPLLGIGANDAAMQQFVFANPAVVSVEAEGSPAQSRGGRRVKGVVRTGGGGREFELVRWIDREVGLPTRELTECSRATRSMRQSEFLNRISC